MIGKEVLNYTIVSLIGKGGMGSVYLAEHKYIKQQKVAIKVINSDMVNDFTRQRLKEEAEHLASLNHQNIVRFHDYHIDELGSIYLIMEYADGISLDKYIQTVSGLIVEDKICPLFEPILDAVEYAHEHNIIHRDIKPANIIITKEGIPKILDFGIATIINRESVEKDDMVMGTPSYMSPEQVRGDHLDSRSDIYSLGVMLHQMLTGNAPYDTTTLTEYDINKKVVEEPLPRMRTYYKYVSDKVQKIVDKATAKEPGERYQTCDDFKKALHRVIYPPKIPKWVWTSVAAIVLLMIGGGVYFWDYNRTKVYYYKDYVEQWGVPQGIGELSSREMSHVNRLYRFEYKKHKLQRMSHVNSKENIIEDGESERNERPLDMLLYYTDKGNISRAKVLDRSGKVLYVKSYNDKLNTVIFQYDDEYGTEKTLGAQTIGYVRALEDNGVEKGKISISIDNARIVVTGTPLNDRLYDFVGKKTSLDDRAYELERQESRMIMDGKAPDEIQREITREREKLAAEMNALAKEFIQKNYDNVLGPGVFIMLCSNFPYPVMTPLIEEIIEEAPDRFKNNSLVKEYVTVARSNMEKLKAPH